MFLSVNDLDKTQGGKTMRTEEEEWEEEEEEEDDEDY